MRSLTIRHHAYLHSLVALLCFFLVTPLQAGNPFLFSDTETDEFQVAEPAKAKSTSTSTAAAEPTLKPQLPPNPGPRQTIAVGKFDAIGAFTAKYGKWDIGGGVSAMLTTALVDSGYFIVSERANISQILSEQEMKGSGAMKKGTGPQLGQLAGVNFIVYGAVTEFGANDEGGGTSIGFSGGALGALGAALSHQSSSGSVAMDIRVVDTSTGAIVDSFTVREEIDNSGFDVSLGYKDISIGTNQFENTPLGQTTRKAIVKAVEKIATTSLKAEWFARVVTLDGKELFINVGDNAGIKPGQKFVIERITKRFNDPLTGELLGTRTSQLGMLELTGVEKKMSYGNYTPLTLDSPEPGDLVKQAK